MRKKILFLFLVTAAALSFMYWEDVKQNVIKKAITVAYIENFRDGPAIDENHVITTMNNDMQIIVNKHDKCVCWYLRWAGVWDLNETAALEYFVKPGSIVVEIGANFGAHTLRMAQLAGQQGHIYAFEANPNVSKYLKQSIALNNITDQVTIYEKAAGDRAGTAYLTYGIQNIGGGRLADGPGQETQEIKMVTLDDTVASSKIDILKIDAEGYEYKILQGAKHIIGANPEIILMLEWSIEQLQQQGSQPQHLIDFLKERDFKIWKIDKHTGGKPTFSPVTYKALLEIPYADIVVGRNLSL